MSVKAFLNDDSYDRGSYHFGGRVAGRYAASEKSDVAYAIDKATEAIPSILNAFVLKSTLADISTKFFDSKEDPEEKKKKSNLAKSALTIGLPLSIVTGFLGAMPRGGGTFGRIIRSLK